MVTKDGDFIFPFINVLFVLRVLSGRGLCDGLIIRPEESCRVWYVWVWPQQRDGLGPSWAVVPRGKKHVYDLISCPRI